MGNSSSSSSSSSRRYRRLLPNKSTFLPQGDAAAAAAGDPETLLLYKWKIEGFSSLLDLGGGDAVDHVSGFFEAGGCVCLRDEIAAFIFPENYIPAIEAHGTQLLHYSCDLQEFWMLHVMTSKSENGKSYISLRLCVNYVLPDSEVEAKYNLLIYDQKHSKHIKEIGIYKFINTSCTGAFHYMIPLETFKDASSGFLINDSCIFGVEILRILHTSKGKVFSEYLSLCTGAASHISFTWNIESCRSLQKLDSSPEALTAGGLKWYIIVYLDGGEGEKYLSVYVKLDEWDASQIEPGVFAEVSLCMKDQKHGKHFKISFCKIYSLKCNTCGCSRFLSYEDLSDPSYGFLVDNACTIEASIAVVGSISYDEK